MKKYGSIIFVLLALLLASTCFAVDVTVFNETFYRANEAPVTVQRTFSGVSGKGTVKIFNGIDKKSRVTVATIKVNGIRVFDERDFNRKVDYFEKEIELANGQNTLDVLLQGKPGSLLTIQIRYRSEEPANLNGSYKIYRQVSGKSWEEPPIHIVSTQTGLNLNWTVPCDPTFPQATGNMDGETFTVTFDFGGGHFADFEGSVNGSSITGTYSVVYGFTETGTFRLEAEQELNCALACENFPVLKFVDTDFTELAKIERISLFRSSAGHDSSDMCEHCRSMKHYYAPYGAYKVNGTVTVFSPADGWITEVWAEQNGESPPGKNKQVHIRSSAHPEYTFILFHVDLLSTDMAIGKTLAKGDPIGTARLYYPDLNQTMDNFDIAVSLQTPYGGRYVSYFDTMTDSLFDNYIARGATSRADFILSKEARDGDSLICSGETFQGSGSLPSWFLLKSP